MSNGLKTHEVSSNTGREKHSPSSGESPYIPIAEATGRTGILASSRYGMATLLMM